MEIPDCADMNAIGFFILIRVIFHYKVHLYEDGFVSSFMEQTDFHTMRPRNDLALGSTKWVLANPGNSYILYTYDYRDSMGAKGMASGWYDLLWLDTETGETVTQKPGHY